MMAIRELKVCLLGDTGVGKSSIVCRFVQDHFDHNISPTIGASFMTKTVPCGNELHKFLIWDTAGQERFHSLAPMYYRGSAAAVIVYDITKQDSFHTLKKWVKELKEHGPENIVMAIAGNKCDLSDIREVPLKDAKEYAESIGAIVVETSAKNAINIEELFQGITPCVFWSSPLHSGPQKAGSADGSARRRKRSTLSLKCNLRFLHELGDFLRFMSPDPTLGPPRKWKQWSNQTWEAKHANQPAVLLIEAHGPLYLKKPEPPP
uniref:RAB31, member RAS oncogene family n=2 Tax=Molossus molossus TaxID=27622 RepID=A0A7J8HJZ8_MOLMO|nr:RAB31, member RAS oncogene family [Molossus molossus]